MTTSTLPTGLQTSLANYASVANTLPANRNPWRYKCAVKYYQTRRFVQNQLAERANTKSPYFGNIIFRHQSVLLKKLGDNNEHLQQQKVQNLRLAANKLDSIVIQPGQTFSYWHSLGRPTIKDGYVPGMLLSRGKVVPGVGGGLCQMSNLLYWMFLHAPVEIVERSHHSYDVFPDSGRVLPFGSGATVFYNYVDLVVKNASKAPLQLKLWLTDHHLKGQIVSDRRLPYKYHVREANHCFVSYQNQLFRYNELYQDVLFGNTLIATNFITKNFAPVLYQTSPIELLQKGYLVHYVTNTDRSILSA